MNIYTVQMKDGNYPQEYYILANSITLAYNLIMDHPDYLDGTVSLDTRIPTTDVSVLLEMYKNTNPDKVPLIVLFIRGNEYYKNGFLAVFYNYPKVAKTFQELIIPLCNDNYRKWVDESTYIRNK